MLPVVLWQLHAPSPAQPRAALPILRPAKCRHGPHGPRASHCLPPDLPQIQNFLPANSMLTKNSIQVLPVPPLWGRALQGGATSPRAFMCACARVCACRLTDHHRTPPCTPPCSLPPVCAQQPFDRSCNSPRPIIGRGPPGCGGQRLPRMHSLHARLPAPPLPLPGAQAHNRTGKVAVPPPVRLAAGRRRVPMRLCGALTCVCVCVCGALRPKPSCLAQPTPTPTPQVAELEIYGTPLLNVARRLSPSSVFASSSDPAYAPHKAIDGGTNEEYEYRSGPVSGWGRVGGWVLGSLLQLVASTSYAHPASAGAAARPLTCRCRSTTGSAPRPAGRRSTRQGSVPCTHVRMHVACVACASSAVGREEQPRHGTARGLPWHGMAWHGMAPHG